MSQFLEQMFQGLAIYPHVPWAPDPELYNCSVRSIEDWYARGTKKPLLGWCSIILGTLAIFFYIIALLAMSNRNFLRNSCYQMLYFTSLYDILTLVISNLVSGYYFIIGANFCTNPRSNFLWGAIACGSWCGLCISVMTLGFGRLSELTRRGQFMFQGRMTFVWIGFSLFTCIFIIFLNHTAVFDSTTGSWAMLPFIDNDIEKEITRYRVVIQPFIVSMTANVLLLTYLFIFLYMKFSPNRIQSNEASRLQKSLLIQCFSICSIFSVTCYLYTIVFYFKATSWIAVMAQTCYQITECAPLLSYIIFNPIIRNAIFSRTIGSLLVKYRRTTLTAAVAPNLR